jgi:MinD superfamily P-loop ATPase
MSKIMVSEERCSWCARCAEDCPVQAIDCIANKANFKESHKKLCLECGHCEAICPQQAITVTDPVLQQPFYNDISEGFPSLQQLTYYFRMRRAVRS